MQALNGAVWRKSTYSGGNSTNCVEISDNAPNGVHIRDSKNRRATPLHFTTPTWHAFLTALPPTARRT
ncbi:DUF397 domain-containing protein [Streptomyces sp. AV19]|uniref:DUF397 domain-containing protein n=1 Tax=Streptomyces sp. AV19 TaxID=2793068 RepID=UPI0018FE4707|nr:DUF397 domain-containing protein [Streptomyces sp. AV19]MBH1935924.1 DUF397 domain-containing protein [Streptomyces sp. AV19]MDG4534293.1 DUF397 domain-containing protein [Streptomyces sp. AV19]